MNKEGARAPSIIETEEDCISALSDNRLVSDPYLAGVLPESSNNLLLMDGSEHSGLRKIVGSIFSSSAIERVSKALRSTCDDLVYSMLDKTTMEFIEDLAEPVVLQGLFDIVDIPVSRRSILGHLLREMTGLLEPDIDNARKQIAKNASLRASAIFRLMARDRSPEGLLALLEKAAENNEIAIEASQVTPLVILHGGYENPLNLLGCLIAWSVNDPIGFRKSAEVSLVAPCEYVLKTFVPVRRVLRWASTTMHAGQVELIKGDPIWINLGDEANYRLKREGCPLPTSKSEKMRSFGRGQHACIGSGLARLEARLITESLLKLPLEKFTTIEIDWNEEFIARGPKSIRAILKY